jgi:hypothetical protein
MNSYIEYLKYEIIKSLNTVVELNKTIKFVKEEGYLFGIVFFTINPNKLLTIYHITNYKEIPDQLNINHAISELENDEDFKLDKEIIDNIQYIIIDFNDIKEIKN